MTPKLADELRHRNLLPDPERAEGYIRAGKVRVEGEVVETPGFEVGEDDHITVDTEPARASRAGLKLANFLDDFPAAANLAQGSVALDLGCGHGGFTEELLRRGAERVYAVDVGWGQLVPKLREDERVEVMERTDLKQLETEDLFELPDVVTSDLSFISQAAVPPLLSRIGFEGLWIGLFKPQFELPEELRFAEGFSDGVVRTAELALAAWENLTAELPEELEVSLLAAAEPAGGEGNREFFFTASRTELPEGLSAETGPGNIIRSAYPEETSK